MLGWGSIQLLGRLGRDTKEAPMLTRTLRLLLLLAVISTSLVVLTTGSVAEAAELDQESTVGLVDPATGEWHLRHRHGAVTSFYYGNPGDVPFTGDWDCDGIDTPGLFRTSDAFAYLRNSNSQGIADIRFFFGNPSDIPLAGDFNGDGCDTLSIYRPSEARFYIMNELGENEGGLGAADYSFLFGNVGDKPVVGDWDGDGIDEIGLHRETTGFFYYRNTLTTGVADGQLFFGDPGDRFVAGDWGVVDGVDTPGMFRPSNSTFYFRHTLTQGNADSQFVWPGAGTNWLPVSGVFSNVEFTIDTTIPDEGAGFGPFTATGAAVDAGWMCPKGDTLDSGVTASPVAGGWRFIGEKTFTCDDGSGTFTLRFDATVIIDPYSGAGTWRVTSGTGDYTKLAGEGALTGTQSETGVLDELWAGAIQNSG
jgi:hypothetical protein